MGRNEDDERYDDWKDGKPRRSQRTKFRDADDRDETAAKRDKHSGKRSHRQKTVKDDHWPDDDA
ncbi:MAG TPA: hypothetical protein VLT88_13850 [Desulfosarcina sp.]|nr:hypothetical protein [Desulfosarcina sp.]